MIEVHVYEYLVLLIFAVIGGIWLGWPLGRWIGKQLLLSYIYIFGFDFKFKDANDDVQTVRVRGKTGVIIAKSMVSTQGPKS